MLKLHSNTGVALQNLRKLEAELLPAVHRAVGVKHWLPLLRTSARQVLQAAAAATEKEPGALAQFIPDLVNSITMAVEAGNTVYRLNLGGSDLGFPVDINRARDFALGRGGGQGEFGDEQANLQMAREMVERWVQEKKDLDEGESVEAARHSILEILGFEKNFVARTTGQQIYTETMDAIAKEMVEKYIQPWASQQAGAAGGGLDADTAREWGQLVLETWRDLVELELPGRLQHELAGLKKFLKK